jgi:hypothetical protein
MMIKSVVCPGSLLMWSFRAKRDSLRPRQKKKDTPLDYTRKRRIVFATPAARANFPAPSVLDEHGQLVDSDLRWQNSRIVLPVAVAR